MKKGCAWMFALMVVGVLFGLLAAAGWTYVMPKKYESEVIIEVKPRPVSVPTSSAQPMTPQFFATEFEKIKSRKALEKVIESLSLTNRWSVDKEEAIRILKGIVTTQKKRESDLIFIRVRHPNNADARDIAEAVALTYRDYRNEIEKRDEEAALMELNKAVREQEEKVEERRKLLATIVNTKGITYKGQDSFYNTGSNLEEQEIKDALMEFDKLESDRLQLKSQIESLLKYDADELMVYAAGIDFPNGVIRNLLPRYQEVQRQLETVKGKGSGVDPTEVRAVEQELRALKPQLDQGVINLRASLVARLKMVESQIKEVEKRKNITREEAIKRGLEAQDYVDAKRDFETDQELLQNLKLKKISIDIGSRIPFQSVDIHDTPKLADSPVSPNVTLNLVIGTLAGAILLPIAGLLVMGVMRIARGNARAGERQSCAP